MRLKAIIDLEKLRYNLDKICEKIPKDKMMAIIKANAYGHGDEKIFLECIKYGIKFFGVATIDEALKLIKINNKVDILILSPVRQEDIIKLSNLGISLTISNFDDIDYIKKNNIRGKFHLAFDTGMGRIGFDKFDIQKAIKLLNPIGIFSHLSFASDEHISYKQKKIFDEVVDKYDIKYKHLLNSIGSFKYFDKKYDLYRIGIILYGLESVNVKAIMSLYARVNNVKVLKEDTDIGYNNTYKAKKGDIIATISAGYADGISRILSNNSQVYFNGLRYNIVGNICMDQFMILADKNIKVGDYVEIFGENISIYEIAQKLNTISYEVLCLISNRVNRIYKERNYDY